MMQDEEAIRAMGPKSREIIRALSEMMARLPDDQTVEMAVAVTQLNRTQTYKLTTTGPIRYGVLDLAGEDGGVRSVNGETAWKAIFEKGKVIPVVESIEFPTLPGEEPMVIPVEGVSQGRAIHPGVKLD